jgi:hypothetical protein
MSGSDEIMFGGGALGPGLPPYPTPELTPLNMGFAVKHEHPEIEVGNEHTYLCLIDDRYYAGSFSRVSFGLTFHGGGLGNSMQFDAPGSNSSKWQMIWKLEAG